MSGVGGPGGRIGGFGGRLLDRLLDRLPALALVVVTFTLVNAAASTLEVAVTPVPQVGSGAAAGPCQSGPLSVGYQVTEDRSAATAMTVEGVSAACAGVAQLTIALKGSSAYFPGPSNHDLVPVPEGTVETDRFVIEFGSPVPIGEFDTGTVTVVLEATTGVSVVP